MTEFTFIGTGTAAPVENLRPSSIYFQMESLTGLLDIGSGAIHSMAGFGIDPIRIQNVFLSHFHSDHVSDLIMLLHSNNATPGKIRKDLLDIYGPEGLQKLLDTLMQLFPETQPETYTLNIHPVNEKEAVSPDGKISVHCCKTGHTSYSLGYRFEGNGSSFVYTGDAAINRELIAFCTGTDTLITECSYLDEFRTEDHLCPKDTAQLASLAGVKRLIVVHRYPQTAKADILSLIKEAYEGEIFIPNEGDTLRFE